MTTDPRSIEWEFQPYSAWVAHCGYCAAQYILDALVHTMDEASHRMMEMGWHATRAGDVYRHICPDCWDAGLR